MLRPAPTLLPRAPLGRRPVLGWLLASGVARTGWSADPGGTEQRWSYRLSGRSGVLPYSATAVMTWRLTASAYTLSLDTRVWLLGQHQIRSQGQWTPNGLRPERFSDSRHPERDVWLDPVAGRFRVGAADAPSQAMPVETQDRLSLLLQLGHALAQAPGLERVSCPVLGVQGADPWTFVRQGPDTLDLAGQDLPCLRLERLPRQPADQQMRLWLSQARPHWPVRIELIDTNGDRLEQRLESAPPGWPGHPAAAPLWLGA